MVSVCFCLLTTTSTEITGSNAIHSQGQEKLEKSPCEVHTAEGERAGLIKCAEAAGHSSGGLS